MRNHADIVLYRKLWIFHDVSVFKVWLLPPSLMLWTSDNTQRMPGTDICKQRNRQKNLRRADWRKKNKHGMDTERETEASVLGANALCERWACHHSSQPDELDSKFSCNISLSAKLSLSLSLWPLGWFATSLLIDNHVGEKPSEAYYWTLRCLRWHFLAGVMTRWH